MNFLLHMLGRASRTAPALRPCPRQQFLHRAAHAAAQGDFPTARAAYRTLTDTGPSTPLDILIRAHLHLICNEDFDAALHFAEGLTRLHQTRAADPLTPTALELLLQRSADHLAHGSFAPATAAIRRARALLDVLLAAEPGLLLSQPELPANRNATGRHAVVGLATLSHLSDLTLRLLARAQIAEHLAGALRERQLPENYAASATSSASVESLLETQRAQLQKHIAALPGHVENLHRLGLTARALGRAAEAATAFGQVLALHPHHVASAARLAAADPAGDATALRAAFRVPAATLHLFARFAATAREPHAFDDLTDLPGAPANPDATIRRANLAFALAELSLWDESYGPWREPAPV